MYEAPIGFLLNEMVELEALEGQERMDRSFDLAARFTKAADIIEAGKSEVRERMQISNLSVESMSNFSTIASGRGESLPQAVDRNTEIALGNLTRQVNFLRAGAELLRGHIMQN
jgi:hypothetical protein